MTNKLTAKQSAMITSYVLTKCSMEKDAGGVADIVGSLARAGVAVPVATTLASAGLGGLYWLSNRDSVMIDRLAKKRNKAIDAKLKELYNEQNF